MLTRFCRLRRRGFKLVIALGVIVVLIVYIQSRISEEVYHEERAIKRLNDGKSRERNWMVKNDEDVWRKRNGANVLHTITSSSSKPYKVVSPVYLEKDRFLRERPSVQVSDVNQKLLSLSNATSLNKNHQSSKNNGVDSIEDKQRSPHISNNRRKLNSKQNLPSLPYGRKKPKSSKDTGPSIRIMPKRPSVPEGRSLMVTCGDVSVLSRKSQDAAYMTFEFPEMMPERLKNAIHILVRPGMVTLRFAHIRKGHAGVYKCVVQDKDGNKFTYDIPIEVLDAVGDTNFLGEGEAVALGRPGDWRLTASKNSLGSRQHLSQEQVDKMIAARESKWAKMGMMDAYEYDYDKVDEIIEQLHEKVGRPKQVNLTALTERGESQQTRVDEFCESRGFGDFAYTLPGEGDYSFYRHMLVNDKAKTLFCFVPKVGCTNLKVLFFVVQGFMPLSQLFESRDKVNQERIESVQLQESFLNRNDFNKEFTLRHYFKFMMVRNPLHRLVSGFRSKVQRFPLKGLNDSLPHYNFLRKAIYLQVHPNEYSEFLRKRGRAEINITFSDFITYWLLQPDNIKFDEHFRSMFKLCQPCRARFNFYANFKNFEEDTRILVKKINTRPEFIRTGYYSDTDSTERLSISYYSQLTQKQKLAVLKQVELDLDFYYHLFPEETGVHNSILGLEEPVSIPLQINS